MTKRIKSHFKTFAMAQQALHSAGFRGLADNLDAARDDYSTKCIALDKAKAVMDQHPRPSCDEHPAGDPIKCGWKRAYADMLDALWIGW